MRETHVSFCKKHIFTYFMNVWNNEYTWKLMDIKWRNEVWNAVVLRGSLVGRRAPGGNSHPTFVTVQILTFLK